MIDFSLTEDQRVILDMVRDFCAKEIAPKARHFDETGEFPREILNKAWDLGLVNVTIPSEYGGVGMDPVTSALILEQMGYACAGISFVIAVNELATGPLISFGSEEQKKKWLTMMCKERLLASLALSEPQAGSDLGGLKTFYKEKDGGYVISGEKAWISNGSKADLYIVFAYPEGAQQLSKLSVFIVPGNSAGLTRGKPEKKLGLKAADTSGVTFENVFVPKENMIGKEGAGFKIAHYSLSRGRTGTAAISTGIQQRCVDECIAYSKTRKAYGKPIGDNPVIRQYIAEMQMITVSSRLATWHSAWKWFKGEDFTYEASIAKALATSKAQEVALKAVQIFGGNGVSIEYPIAKLVNDTKLLELVEGTTEIQRALLAEVLMSKGAPRYFSSWE